MQVSTNEVANEQQKGPPMYNLELFAIVVYCLIAEELYPNFCQRYGKPRRAGFSPTLSDAECLTIEIVGQFLGYPNQKQLFERMRERFGAWFPDLKDREAFVRQSANLWQVKVVLHQQLVERLGGHHAPCQIIDTMPLPICHLARRWRRKIFKTDPVFDFPQPTKGYCAAKKEDYFGFKGVDLTRFGGYLISWEKGDPLCRQHVHLIHLSSKSKWSNWFEPVVRQESWPKSSSPQTRRSGTGWYRPTETRAFEKTV